MPGAADSWYHEKESAWLYGVVAAAEEQAACWRRSSPGIPDDFRPALRARVVAHAMPTSASEVGGRHPPLGASLG